MNGSQESKSQNLVQGARPDSIILTEDNGFWNWFAGFWEGEGSFFFAKRGGVTLSVPQNDVAAINYIREKIGTGYISSERKREGKNYLYTWRIHNRALVIKVAEKMLPFLRFKGDAVQEKLERLKQLYTRSPERSNIIKRKWTSKDDKYLVENYGKMRLGEMARELGRTSGSIFNRAFKLKLTGIKFRRWMPDEDEVLTKKYAFITDLEIGKILNRSEYAVTDHRQKLGLSKPSPWNKGKKLHPLTPEHRHKLSESLKRACRSGRGGGFKKGNIPWNKGKKGVYSEKTLRKISEANAGRVPWNKGKKRQQVPWNKGKTF